MTSYSGATGSKDKGSPAFGLPSGTAAIPGDSGKPYGIPDDHNGTFNGLFVNAPTGGMGAKSSTDYTGKVPTNPS